MESYATGDNELNNYEDDEFDDDDDECNGGREGEAADSDCDSEELEHQLARVAFGDLVASNLSLEDEKLLDLLQRRLFPSAASAAERRDAVQRTPAPVSSPPGRLVRPDLQLFSLAPAAADASTISPEKVDRMVHRFRLQEEKRALKLRTQRAAAEHPGHTFAPALNCKSLQMTQRIPKFLDRQRKHALRQQQQREEHSQAQARDRTRDLEEHVKTPCICSRGGATTANTSPPRVGGHSQQPLSAGAQQTHTRACLRFMDMCSTMNASFAVQRRKHEMRRSIDDMLAFHEQKQQRQRARSAIARAQEAADATFTPQINPRSEKIYAEMVRSGRLQSGLSDGAQPKPAPPNVPSLSFRPTISKNSIALLRKKQKASSAALPAQRDGERESAADAVDADVFFRLHSEQLPRGDGECRSLQSSARHTNAKQASAQWNEVAYDDAKHSFILRNFDLTLFGA